MYAVRLPRDADEAAFRDQARRCLSLGLPPSEVVFVAPDEPSLFAPIAGGDSGHACHVPRAYGELLRDAICHSAADRFALLYDVLWRLVHGERELIHNATDPAV